SRKRTKGQDKQYQQMHQQFLFVLAVERWAPLICREGGPRRSDQPILILAEPAAMRGARLLAAARIRTSLPFIFLRPPTGLCSPGAPARWHFPLRLGCWVDLGRSLRRGTPHAPGSSPGTLSCQHGQPLTRPLETS